MIIEWNMNTFLFGWKKNGRVRFHSSDINGRFDSGPNPIGCRSIVLQLDLDERLSVTCVPSVSIAGPWRLEVRGHRVGSFIPVDFHDGRLSGNGRYYPTSSDAVRRSHPDRYQTVGNCCRGHRQNSGQCHQSQHSPARQLINGYDNDHRAK